MTSPIPFCLLLLMLPLLAFTQPADNDAVLLPVQQLFDGMRNGDSTMVRYAFTASPVMETVVKNKAGQTTIQAGNLLDFLNAVGTPHDEVWDEKIWSYEIRQDGQMASVWTPYTFYVGDKMSHCGVNNFTLLETENGWKINHIIDTRRRDNCREVPTPTLQKIMDDWHHAAAVADEDVFFNTLAPQGIYIGTDASERWTKQEFKAFAMPYFQRDTAWAFTPLERQFYYSQDGMVAWFNETLDTWMGTCRGSGILEKTAQGWVLQHYHLAIAVPNEKVKGYLELLKK